MDDEQRKRVEELARERVKMAFGQTRIDEQTAGEVEQLLEREKPKNDEGSLFGKSDVLSASGHGASGSNGASVTVQGDVSQTSARMTDNIEEYHRAWQEYYRKYYQYHFGQEIQKKDAEHKAEVKNLLMHEDTIDENARLMQRLRQQVRGKTHASARKFRRSKHYIPIVVGLLVFLALVVIQYNRAFLAFVSAYITPVGNARGLEFLETDNADGPSRLMIPKINVNVPIIFGCGMDQASQRRCMRQGIMHFAVSGANAVPGENGNFAVSGHSSNDAFGGGDFKFIFSQLPRMTDGDLAYVNYEGVRYTYVVREIIVVDPDDVQSLRIGDERPVMTLITCYPIGTARQRMLIFMDQIAPLPDTAVDGTETAPDDEETTMAGISPTLLERMWARLTGGGL